MTLRELVNRYTMERIALCCKDMNLKDLAGHYNKCISFQLVIVKNYKFVNHLEADYLAVHSGNGQHLGGGPKGEYLLLNNKDNFDESNYIFTNSTIMQIEKVLASQSKKVTRLSLVDI